MRRSPEHESLRIGVTGPDRGGFWAWFFTRWALYRCGARAIRITPSRPYDRSRLHGVVLGGGADVTEPLIEATTPERIEGKPRIYWPGRVLDLCLAPFVLALRWLGGTRGHGIDRARDVLELELLNHARQLDLPVLGICRGAQLLSLFEGGALQRNVNAEYQERPQLYTVLPRREVRVIAHSRLHDVLGAEELLVNSLHFHAVSDAGRAMRVSARETSGVPQAIEHTERAFWIGVQWHPEYLPQHEIHMRLFRRLAEQARARLLGRASAILPCVE
jgi:putative glutamine amidotransferase